MNVESGDIIYAIIVIGTTIIAYRVTRSIVGTLQPGQPAA